MRFERAVVVDDEPASRAVLRHVLEILGISVAVAESGEEGLELALAGEVDVVVTDLLMPGMGGVGLAARLHEEWGPERPPLIAVTRHPEDASRSGLFDLVLRKPVSPGRLLGWLQDHDG
jgi:twitching motility two-component system response regulator PilH